MKTPRFLHSWKFYLIIVIIIWIIIGVIVYFVFFNNNNVFENGGKIDCSRDIYNCDDFSSQQEARMVFDSCNADVHRLDTNNDDIPCEDLR